MNIGSNSSGPAKKLSNFTGHGFVFDGIEISSPEGFLQSLKFDKPHIQREVCKLVGFAAKKRGSQRNSNWKRVQKLWWNGVEYDRHSDRYQQLLNAAYKALYDQNESFRSALLSTGNAVLVHTIGSNDPSHTVLTESEFCSRLTRLRDNGAL